MSFSSAAPAGSPSRWFQDVFGFPEPQEYEQVRQKFRIEQDNAGSITLHTVPPDALQPRRSFHVGRFETPSVQELLARLNIDNETGVCLAGPRQGDSTTTATTTASKLSFQHMVGDAGELHRNPSHAGAVFQAASQFNCLEMPSPQVRPEAGITNYCYDRTQGPACALACPAGTLFRNYFVNTHGQGGGKQLDLLSDVGDLLGNANTNSKKPNYWKMKNGYVRAATRTSIRALGEKLVESNETALVDAAIQKMRVGVHWDTEVYSNNHNKHRVAQVYCSALPIAYDQTAASHDWQPFAQLVLHGVYQATLAAAAVLARQRPQERVTVFLTFVGGGVFGNDKEWIVNALRRALDMFRTEPLDVFLVHYRYLDEYYVGELPPIVNHQGAGLFVE